MAVTDNEWRAERGADHVAGLLCSVIAALRVVVGDAGT